jgi:hypothetical protein
MAHHPGDDLTVLVTEDGTVFQNEAGASVFFAVGVGRRGDEGALQGAGECVRTERSLNRVTLHRTVLSEQVDTLPEGVKQTFILRQRPQGGGPLSLVMGVGGSYERKAIEPERILFQSACGQQMAYEDLAVYDAEGRELPARFEAGERPETFCLVIDDQDAVYPVEIDPVFRPFRTQFLLPTEARPSDRFTLTEEGTVLRMEGDLLVVGVPGFDLYPLRSTANVQKTVRNMAGLAAEGARAEKFGMKRAFKQQLQLAMQVLGFLGEYRIDDVGAVYVFMLVEGVWELLDVLNDWEVAVRYDKGSVRPTRLDGARFGETVALKNRRLIIGAPGIKSESWVNLLAFSARIAGPHTTGGLYFFEQPFSAEPFYRRGAAYGVRSNLGALNVSSPDFEDLRPVFEALIGPDWIDYREVGRAVALDDSRAVVTSGAGFNPNEIGARYSGYGPTKFHHFVRQGNTWRRIADRTTATDLPGRVTHVAMVNGEVYSVEEYNGSTRLWSHAFPTSPTTPALRLVHTWWQQINARFDADERGWIIAFPASNQVFAGEVTADGVALTALSLPSGLTEAGRTVARGNETLLLTGYAGQTEQLHLYNRAGQTGAWQRLADQALNFPGGARAVGIADTGVAVLGRHADDGAHSDLLVYSLNRTISGTVRLPDGQPAGSGFRVVLEAEPTPIPAQAARLFDGANLVPFAAPPWTINHVRDAGLLFSVNDRFGFLDNFLLEVTLSNIPPEMQGQELIVNARLPFQEFTWGGRRQWDRPGFGAGRIPLREGRHVIDLFGWYEDGFRAFAEEFDIQTMGEWELTIGFTGPNRGVFPYARVESANLLLVEKDSFGLRYAVTDAAGGYRFENLPPGRYRVVPAPFLPPSGDYGGSSAEIDLAATPFASGADVELVGAFGISGKALTVNGFAIQDVELELVGPTGESEQVIASRTAGDGAFSFRGLVSGSYTLRTTGLWRFGNG